MAFFDDQGAQLSDAIPQDSNNVGYVVDNAYGFNSPAVLDSSNSTPVDSEGTTRKAQRTANADNRQAALDSGYGMSPHQGPLGWTSAITGFADRIPQFFRPNGNEYTNSLVDARKPVKGQALKAVTPQDTYDKFFARLRNFARAEETSEKGRVQTRGR